MKVIAFYLPQFHEIEENNIWWGKGFTEWTNVKGAKSLYEGHNQPIEPLSGHYNLLDESVVKWQADLAEKYGVYGFCYYHYWFEGRKILEKPAENLLNNKSINKRFCFCWANHSWRKTWNGTMEMLIEQGYGDELEWEEHFKYLNKFFQDERYIKIDDKPVFMIFKPEDIPLLDKRIKYYNKRCIEHGFKGIYIIESININGSTAISNLSRGIVLREPSVSLVEKSISYRIKSKFKRMKKYLKIKEVVKYDFDKVSTKSLKIANDYKSEKTIFLGSFAGWDSTPRHKENGYIIDGFNKEKFKSYLMRQQALIKNRNMGEFVFLNAWNEWAEGMFLEPDTKHKYEKLEAIAEVLELQRLSRY